MNTKEKKYLSNLINKYDKSNSNSPFYSLVGEPFLREDLIAGIETLLRGRITMSEITKKFELEFAILTPCSVSGRIWHLMVSTKSCCRKIIIVS